MTQIPIYDDTVPVACTASNELIPRQIEMVECMRDNLQSIERTEHGVLIP